MGWGGITAAIRKLTNTIPNRQTNEQNKAALRGLEGLAIVTKAVSDCLTLRESGSHGKNGNASVDGFLGACRHA